MLHSDHLELRAAQRWAELYELDFLDQDGWVQHEKSPWMKPWCKFLGQCTKEELTRIHKLSSVPYDYMFDCLFNLFLSDAGYGPDGRSLDKIPDEYDVIDDDDQLTLNLS